MTTISIAASPGPPFSVASSWAIAVQVLLSLLGAGIGLGTVDATAGTTPNASTLGIGAGLWWVISSVVALGAGGYVAAWLAGIELRFDGVLHGLVTWGIATLVTLYLLTSAIGGIIGRRLFRPGQCDVGRGQRHQRGRQADRASGRRQPRTCCSSKRRPICSRQHSRIRRR